MEFSGKVEGHKDVMKTMQAAFPADPKQQQRLLNAAMRKSAQRSILPLAKNLALTGDGSGALSESLGIRAQKQKDLRRKKLAGGVQIVSVRNNMNAIALYMNHYYTSRGKTVPASVAFSGIRHGHLVEWGFIHTSGKAVSGSPFLWPAARYGASGYKRHFAADLKKKIVAAVKRRAKKRAKR